MRTAPRFTLFPYTTLFRSLGLGRLVRLERMRLRVERKARAGDAVVETQHPHPPAVNDRSEEHTSELQSRVDLVCRLLLEKKNTNEGSLCAPSLWSALFRPP